MPSPFKPAGRQIVLLSGLFAGVLSVSSHAASLSLASGPAAPGGSATVDLSLSNGTGSAPNVLQWTIAYSTSQIASISVAVGAALNAVGKTVTCNSVSGSVTCVAAGLNNSPVGSGVVAAVTVQVASGSTGSAPLSLSNLMGSATDGSAVSVSGTGGTISIQTQSISPVVSKLSCSPTSIVSGATATCTVTLSAAAPSGGSTVTLSDNSSVLTTPASVKVAAGATTASFTVTAGTVTANQSATLTATLNGSVTGAVTVTPPAVKVSKLSCSPTSIVSGATATCTVTLSAAAPSGGSTVTLSDNSSALTTPASVKVAAGATTASFTVTAGTVTANQSATLTATLNGSVTGAVTVTPPAVKVSKLTCSLASIASGASASCTVTLSAAAPSGGSTVTLSDNSSVLTTPASVKVAAGATTASFTVTAGTVTANLSATITASLNGSSTVATLILQAPTTTSSLAAAYSFNEGSGTTTADLSGNGNTGIIKGAAWTSTAKHGRALSFNGSSYVDAGNGKSLQGTGSMTWSAWIYATANPSDDGNIIAKSSWGSHLIGWQFKTTPDTGSHTFGILISADGSSYTERCSKTVRALNTWYYVAAVFNASAGTLDIYVNGVLDNGTLYGTVPKAQFTPALSATIGKRYDGFAFSGSIDDLRVYNRALSLAEIRSDMNTPPAATSSTSLSSVTSGVKTTSPQPDSEVSSSASSAAARRISALACSPRTVQAGGKVTCELQLSRRGSVPVQLASSSSDVKVPSAVAARSNQSSLSFTAIVDPAARQQSAMVTASLGDSEAQQSIVVSPGMAPVLTAPGRQTAAGGAAIDFEIEANDPAGLPVRLSARSLPAGAVFDDSGNFHWVPSAAQAGRYQLTFTATNSAGQSSSATVPVEVDSGRPSLETQALSCSPGAIAGLRGKWLARSRTVLADPTGDSTALGGTTVEINGTPVPVLYLSQTEVRFLCPELNAGTALSAKVQTASGTAGTLAGTMLEATPSIASLDDSGQGLISLAVTGDLAMYRNFRMPSEPAQPGDEILITATGLSPAATNSPWRVVVRISGIDEPAESVVPLAGAAGFFTIRARVPAAADFGDAVPVQIQVFTLDGRRFTSNSAAMTVEPVRN